jgi:hypothetical protein
MSTRGRALLISTLTAIGVAGPCVAADDVSVKKDLFTVITLQGLPCGEVIDVTTKGDNDHIASCKDGNRYHVFLNAQGRVVVERQ